MKKSVIAVFGVSITAGTVYLTYTEIKKALINRMVTKWLEQVRKQEKTIDLSKEDIKAQLDNLYLWDLILLKSCADSFMRNDPSKILELKLKKLRDRKIAEKTNLKALAGIVLPR